MQNGMINRAERLFAQGEYGRGETRTGIGPYDLAVAQQAFKA